MEKRDERIKFLMSDEKFVKELCTLKSAEAAKSFFNEYGVGFSLNDFTLMGKIYKKMQEGDSELSDEELNQVAGGNNPVASGAYMVCAGVLKHGAAKDAFPLFLREL